MSEEPKNLMSGLLEEMNRNRELLKMYEEIPQGAFGAMFIRKNIKEAENAIASNDIGAMVHWYKELKEAK